MGALAVIGFPCHGASAAPTASFAMAGPAADTLAKLALPDNRHIQLRRIEGGGHYLLHERPSDVARICGEMRQKARTGRIGRHADKGMDTAKHLL